MKCDDGDDQVWHTAIDWLMREHDGELDEREFGELRIWLAESPVHRETYREAERLWLLTGLVPPADER